MRTRPEVADAEIHPRSAKTLTPIDDGPLVMMTRAQLRELVADVVGDALAEFEAGKKPGPDLLTAPQMADKLGISRSKLHALRAAGAVPAVKVGDVYRYVPADVMAALRSAE